MTNLCMRSKMKRAHAPHANITDEKKYTETTRDKIRRINWTTDSRTRVFGLFLAGTVDCVKRFLHGETHIQRNYYQKDTWHGSQLNLNWLLEDYSIDLIEKFY